MDGIKNRIQPRPRQAQLLRSERYSWSRLAIKNRSGGRPPKSSWCSRKSGSRRQSTRYPELKPLVAISFHSTRSVHCCGYFEGGHAGSRTDSGAVEEVRLVGGGDMFKSSSPHSTVMLLQSTICYEAEGGRDNGERGNVKQMELSFASVLPRRFVLIEYALVGDFLLHCVNLTSNRIDHGAAGSATIGTARDGGWRQRDSPKTAAGYGGRERHEVSQVVGNCCLCTIINMLLLAYNGENT